MHICVASRSAGFAIIAAKMVKQQQCHLFMTSLVSIYLKSFDSLLIEKSQVKILQINNYLNSGSKRVALLPTLKKRFTVLRSPHIDKKSREQFEWKRYKKSIGISFQKRETVDLFLFLLKNSSFPGVQMEINWRHSTFFSDAQPHSFLKGTRGTAK